MYDRVRVMIYDVIEGGAKLSIDSDEVTVIPAFGEECARFSLDNGLDSALVEVLLYLEEVEVNTQE
jgi:hypothetical protein